MKTTVHILSEPILTGIVLAIFLALVLGACAPVPGASGPAQTPAPTGGLPETGGTPGSAGTGTQAPTGAPTGAPAGAAGDSLDALIQALQASGATVTKQESLPDSFFQVGAQRLSVNGLEVQVFEFPDEAARQAAAATIQANGYIIGLAAVDWMDQPNFWAAGRLVVLYVGQDADLIARLTSLLGEPLTAAQQPDTGGFAPAVDIARRQFAQQQDLNPDQVEVLSAEETEWSDSCLGLGGPAELCAQVITPGWRIQVKANGQEYEIHSNQTGDVIRVR